MKKTGVKAKKEDFEKLVRLARQGWRPGEPVTIFSSDERVRKDIATVNAHKACHQLALDYGLPEIPGCYGIDAECEFFT